MGNFNSPRKNTHFFWSLRILPLPGLRRRATRKSQRGWPSTSNPIEESLISRCAVSMFERGLFLQPQLRGYWRAPKVLRKWYGAWRASGYTARLESSYFYSCFFQMQLYALFLIRNEAVLLLQIGHRS